MKKVALALTLAGALVASAYEYEFTPTIGGVKPEGNLDLKNHLTYGFRLGKNLEGSMIDQVEVGLDYAHYVKVKNSGGAETDITRFYANAVKNVADFGNIKLYGLVGLGYEDFAKEFAHNDNNFFGQYGAGLRYNFTDRVALKSEIRHAIKFDHGDNNLFVTLGIGIAFGETAPAPAPAPAVVPEEPKKAPVSLDDDNDGVVNEIDECPGTPEGVVVDEKGCPKVIRLQVHFDFDKSVIPASYVEKIENVAKFMNDNPIYKVVLEGHTDSTGTEKYNQKLSERRAAAVQAKLAELGVDASRISSVGYGETAPVADNKTKAGRAENRRVDSKFNY